MSTYPLPSGECGFDLSSVPEDVENFVDPIVDEIIFFVAFEEAAF